MAPALIIAAASALGSLISTWKGTSDAAKQNKKSQELINRQLAQAEADNARTPDNYLDTQEGKNISRIAGEQLKEATNATNNNAVKTGATEEQRLAKNAGIQKTYNNLQQNLAAQSTRYADDKRNRLQRARDNYTSAQIGINTNQAQSDVNAGVGVANAIGNLGSAAIQTYGNEKSTTTPTHQQDNTVDPKKTFDIVNTPQDNVAYEDFNKNVYNMQKPMQSWRSYFKQYNIA
jgi:hypothetical protein